MKRCSYCGKEYSDDTVVCPVDGEDLNAVKREKVTGVWRGVYVYGGPGGRTGKEPVAFTLRLKQGWASHFTGSVTEDPPHGAPGTGTIKGYFEMPGVEFAKQMPVGYVTGPDGERITLREHFISQGHPCDHELPSAPISYKGTFLDPNRVQGVWTIPPQRISLQDGYFYTTSRISGFWCAQFMGADEAGNPSGGPTEPLFDKALLTPEELEEIENPPRQRLGLFSVRDAERIMDRLTEEKIRFDPGRDDTAFYRMNAFMATYGGGGGGETPMILLFVHPEDMARAEAIVAEGQEV